MKPRQRTVLLITALSAIMLFSTQAQAKIVCWKNSDGVRECGNSVPPEYAQKETKTINKQGRTTEVKERAKTTEEIKVEKAKQAEEERLAAELAAEEERVAEEEKNRQEARDAYDHVILATYITEKDIERSRERHFTAIDASIKVTNDNIGKQQLKLDAEKKKAANYERKGKKIPKRVQDDISSLQQQIDDKKKFIAAKESEKTELDEKYNAEIKRFRELKGNETEAH